MVVNILPVPSFLGKDPLSNIKPKLRYENLGILGELKNKSF